MEAVRPLNFAPDINMLPIRSWGRLRQVIVVATRCGLSYLTDRLSAKPPLRYFFYRRRLNEPPLHIVAEKVVNAMELLGPTYVKLGQFLSTRSDILPPAFINTLSRLYKDVAPISFEDIRTVISEEFNQPLENLYDEFSSVPRAAASLAQVHAAKLKNGEPVAVKIQRPGIAKIIRADMEILEELASLVNRRIPEARIFRPEELVKEFGYQLNRELDFQLEAMRIERFRTHFSNNPDVYLPRVFWDYSTSRVLTMELVEGVPLFPGKLEKSEISSAEIARRIFETFLKEVLDFGMFHADPHPGNICVLDKQICLLDFGQVGILHETDRDILFDVIFSLINDDIDSLMAAFYRFKLISSDINERLFRRDITDLFERYKSLPARRVQLGQFIIDSIRICRNFDISFPPDMALLGKSLLMVESMAGSLDPQFEPIKYAGPVVREIRKKHFEPDYLSKKLRRKARLAGQGLAELPGLMFSIARKAESGRFKIHFLHEGLEGSTRELERSLNRLALALIISAVIICVTIITVRLLGS